MRRATPDQRLCRLRVESAWKRSFRIVVAGLVMVAIFSASAQAVGFLREVTNTNDSGMGSLRQAISDPEVSNTNDTIFFAPGLSGAITLTGGFLEISASMIINGPGANALAVQGNAMSRVFQVDSNTNVSISGLTIRNGFDMSGNGVGINNFGALTIANCAFKSDVTESGDGGGIFNAVIAGLTVNNSTFDSNTAGGAGGGIYNSGNATVSNSTFSGNFGATEGGGIDNHGILVLNNCTFSGNNTNVTGQGGGINNGSNAAIFKNTIVANTSSGGNCANAPLSSGSGRDTPR